jgi:acetyl-CoA carboxylase carboxyl transferase subunit alpha
VIGGIGRFRGRSVVALGTEKGADTQARLRHNFGEHPNLGFLGWQSAT